MASDQRMSADIARENNEPLYGTIKSADVWFLLEYNGIYTREVWDDARIPQEVIDKLKSYRNSHPLLIRQPDQINEIDGKISFFIVHGNTKQPIVYRFDLNSYKDVLNIDFDAVLAGDVVNGTSEALYLICTNGKRDICCAKYGIALYNAMVEQVHTQVWQCSHFGGHRFAGTMYCFPHGLCYGFLTAEDAEAIVESYTHRRLLLNKLRGRAIYDKPIQAAEYFLRREFDNDQMNDVIYQSHTEDDGKWSVIFNLAGTSYKVNVAQGTPLQVIATTGNSKLKTVPQYSFVDYQIL